MPSDRQIRPTTLTQVEWDLLGYNEEVQLLAGWFYHPSDQVLYVMKQYADSAVNWWSRGVVYKPVVLKGEDFTDERRFTGNVFKVASDMQLSAPPPWLARILRKSIRNKEIAAMGLSCLVVMHGAIKDLHGEPTLLGLCCEPQNSGLRTYLGYQHLSWPRDCGFVFLAR